MKKYLVHLTVAIEVEAENESEAEEIAVDEARHADYGFDAFVEEITDEDSGDNGGVGFPLVK